MASAATIAVPAGASIEPLERRAEAPRDKKRREEKKRVNKNRENKTEKRKEKKSSRGGNDDAVRMN